MIKMQDEFYEILLSDLKDPAPQCSMFVFALFEAHTMLRPFINILNLITITYPWI